jgi:GDP-L-fucose synthase
LRIWSNFVEVVKGMDVVIHLAARVGGIGYNRDNPGQLFYDNAIMGIQIIEAARLAGAKKIVVVGTVCAYPKFTPVPFREDALWDGYPEETNAPYGVAKKILLVQAQAYRQQFGSNIIYLLPANLYGPRDNFDLGRSHVIPSLISKMVSAAASNAKMVDLWGSGEASREFLYVADAAEGIILATEKYNKEDPVNLGVAEEVRIRELAIIIATLTGFVGDFRWDHTKPDGQPRRSLDTTKANREFGFTAKTPLEEGLRMTVDWYRRQGMT